MFELHPRLRKDCIEMGRFTLSRLLLMNDRNFPWFILVPEREGIGEIYQLSDADQRQLIQESSCLSQILVDLFAADKINVAALGNLVPQLHVHHVVRYRDDKAWPAPIWGFCDADPYGEDEVSSLRMRLGAALFAGPQMFFPK